MKEVKLPTKYGEFKLIPYGEKDKLHFALVRGEIKNKCLVRIHSECFTGDVLGSLRCDCGEQLEKSLKIIGKKGGVVLYLRQEGRGIGLSEKLKAYVLQEKGMDTNEANIHLGHPIDFRDYKIAADILNDLGIMEIRLLTNNPLKISELQRYGIKVSRVPLIIKASRFNKKYLKTKKEKNGHLL